MKRTESRQSGFTLIEMLLCLALAGLLMVVLLSVVGSIRRGYRQAFDNSAASLLSDSGNRGLTELVHRDLLQARRVVTQSDGVVQIVGPVGLDPVSWTPTHQPADVRYVIVRAGSHPCLVRQQTIENNLSNRNTNVEVAAVDVANFTVSFAADPVNQTVAAEMTVTWTTPGRPSLQAHWLIR